MTTPEPSGCRHCGVGHRTHFSRHSDGVGRHQYEPPTEAQILDRMTARRTPAQVLADLRWRPDMVVTNDDGDRVWLKSTGTGVTDCCSEDESCDRHATMATTRG